MLSEIDVERRLMSRESMPQEGSFRGLRVWRESMLLVEDIYRLSRRFPADERFGLTSQIRRAAISIPSNIGEGGRRKRRKAHLHHLDIALGSQGEVDVQLELARRLTYIGPAEYEKVAGRIDDVGKMLYGLIESLQPAEEEWS